LSIWDKNYIEFNGQIVEAIEPVIISASRANDIPAFGAKQFIEQLKTGFCIWTNPFNNKNTFISFKKTKLIVFWTKKSKKINTISKNYRQFTNRLLFSIYFK